MGASASVDLRPEEVAELQDMSSYEPKEIKVLYKRFRRLDRSGRGTISLDDLTMIPEIAMNPLSPRLAVLFERDSEDRINFKSFVSALAIFSDKSRPEAKCRGSSMLWDASSHATWHTARSLPLLHSAHSTRRNLAPPRCCSRLPHV